MTKSLWLKRTALLMCLLVLFLCLVPGFQQPAKAIVGVDDLTIVLLAALASFGVTFAATDGIEAVSEFINDQFSEYAQSISSNAQTLWSKIKYGVTSAGEFILNGFGLSYFSEFGDWLLNQLSLSDNDSITYPPVAANLYSPPFISSVSSSDDYSTFRSSALNIGSNYSGRNRWVAINPSSSFSGTPVTNLQFFVFVVGGNSYGGVYIVTKYPSTTYRVVVSSFLHNLYFSRSYSYSLDIVEFYYNSTYDLYYAGGSNYLQVDPSYVNPLFLPFFPTLEDGLYAFSSMFSPDDVSSVIISSSVLTVPDSSDFTSSDGLIIDYGGSWGDTFDDFAQTVVDSVDNASPLPASYSVAPESTLEDFLPQSVVIDNLPLPVVVQGSVTTVLGGGSISINNGAEDAIPVYLPGGITLTWPADGLPIEWPADGIPIDWGDAPSITMELPDSFFDDLTGAISDALDESYGLANQYKSPGLSDIFPFCIPFDIYHFFEALAADPVAPCFEIPFYVEGLVDYTFEIDLSVFESVAQVVRIMELLLFCVGLALVTRNLIRG